MKNIKLLKNIKIFKNHKYKVYKMLIIIIMIIFIIFLYKISINMNNIINNVKVCVCTLGKLENRYIREFVEHYLKYGVDKIILYDNNDDDGEKFEEVINDYIKNNFVEIINYRSKKGALFEIMNDCYYNNYKKYDWFIFYQIDEFIYLKNYKNIKLYLSNDRFKNCETIQLNWLVRTDNNLLYYENKTLKERFTQKEKKALGKKEGIKQQVKSIMRGNISNITINNSHYLSRQLKNCNGFGKPQILFGLKAPIADFYYYYIDHYYSKSTEEFINKLNKGDAYFKDDIKNILNRISYYFYINEITEKKIEFIENKTGLNLSIYRNKIGQIKLY